MSQKKVEKKRVFVFTNFFFKIVFGHLFMSNFKIKKEFQKVQVLSFSSLFYYSVFGEMGQDVVGLFCNARNEPRTAREYLKVYRV